MLKWDEMTKWHFRFIDLAREISRWSKDPSTQVGAILVDKDRRIVSTGYNGFPKGIEDTDERLNNRDIKNELVVHAEINAVAFAKEIKDCTMYTYPFGPCVRCVVQLLQYDINKFVFLHTDNERWKDSIEKSKKLIIEAGKKYIEYPDFVLSNFR